MKKPSFTLYEDGDIGIYDLGIKTQEPLLETGPKKTDRITVVACVEGRLQVEINERKYLINGQDILLCRHTFAFEVKQGPHCVLQCAFKAA